MIEEKYCCFKCKKRLIYDEIYFFGSSPEGRKVWCSVCWMNLQHWLQIKRLEEKIPTILEQAQQELKSLEQHKKKFINLISQLKRFTTSLEKKNPKLIQGFTEQKKLKLQIEKND